MTTRLTAEQRKERHRAIVAKSREGAMLKARNERATRRSRFEAWIKVMTIFAESRGLRGAHLEQALSSALNKHVEYDRQIRRLLKGQIQNPRPSTIFELGVGFNRLGVDCSSGTLALYLCGYEIEAFKILDAAKDRDENDSQIFAFVFCSGFLYSADSDERFVAHHICAQSTSKLLPSEEILFADFASSFEHGHDELSLACAVMLNQVKVEDESRAKIIYSLLSTWHGRDKSLMGIAEALKRRMASQNLVDATRFSGMVRRIKDSLSSEALDVLGKGEL